MHLNRFPQILQTRYILSYTPKIAELPQYLTYDPDYVTESVLNKTCSCKVVIVVFTVIT